MAYSWEFSQGSFINIVWKNAIVKNDQNIDALYFANLSNTLAFKQNNNISLRVLYYLDYLKLKGRK